MDLSEFWAPEVTYEDIKNEGTLITENFNPNPYNNTEKITCKLYYLKSKDLFVTLLNEPTDTLYNNTFHVITDNVIIMTIKFQYFGYKYQTFRGQNDTFLPNDKPDFTEFKSDFDLRNPEIIKKYGKLVETDELNSVYFVEPLNTFVSIFSNNRCGPRFDSIEYRKKYNIPYRD